MSDVTVLPAGNNGPRSFKGSFDELASADHVHNSLGYCLKNRYGQPCADPVMPTPATPTPGIAGRYFVRERRERFAKLTARVTVGHAVGFTNIYITTLTNRELLSPRRIARKLRVGGAQANTIADRISAEMQCWSLEGFRTTRIANDPTLRGVGDHINVGNTIVRLQEGSQL